MEEAGLRGGAGFAKREGHSSLSINTAPIEEERSLQLNRLDTRPVSPRHLLPVIDQEVPRPHGSSGIEIEGAINVTTEPPAAANNISDEDISEDRKLCRYCYDFVGKQKNVSSCRCKTMLCENCLLKEIRMTTGRHQPAMMCTTCKTLYNVEMETEQPNCLQLTSFFFRNLLPCQSMRDMTVFRDVHSLLPLKTAQKTAACIIAWYIFTIVAEVWAVVNHKWRAPWRSLVYFFDMLGMLEVFRVTVAMDIPERAPILFIHLIRIGIFTSVMLAVGMKHYIVLGDGRIHTISLLGDWITVYMLTSFVYCVLEGPRLFNLVRNRSARAALMKTKISIRNLEGKLNGPYVIPREDAEQHASAADELV